MVKEKKSKVLIFILAYNAEKTICQTLDRIVPIEKYNLEVLVIDDASQDKTFTKVLAYKNNKKLMLIEPPFYRLYHDQHCLVKYPLALGYLSGSIIKNTDWSVQTYNADFNVKKKSFDPNGEYLSGKGFKRYLSSLKDHSLPIWKEVKTSIEEYNPSVIGFTVKSQNFTSATVIAKIAKEINPKIKILVGGAHSTMNGSKVFECDDIDFACIGEGENTIAELLNALEKNIDLNSVMFYKKNT